MHFAPRARALSESVGGDTADGVQIDKPSEFAVSWVYVLCASASAICCTLVLLLHIRRRALSRFPSSLLLWRIVCDLVLSVQFIVLNLTQILRGGQHACTAQLAFLAQFGLLGSLGWYACLSLNFYFSVTRPFTRPAGRTTAFHTLVWLGAVSSGLVASADHGYRPLYHTCWTHETERTSLLNWSIFFIWVILFSFFSVVALVLVQLQLVVGGAKLQQRLRPRLEQLRISQYYTFAFSIYWAVVGTTYLFMYVRYEVMGLHSELPIRLFFASALGLLGTVDATVWFFVRSNISLTSRQQQLILGGLPAEAAPARENDLSDALRHEFVKHTIVGIVTSTRTVNAEAACTSPAYRKGSRRYAQANMAAVRCSGQGGDIEGGLKPLSRPLLDQESRTQRRPGLADFDPLIPHLTRGHFSERHTLELAPGVYFQDFAPMVWQALRQEVYGVSFTRYLRSLMGRSSSEMETFIEAMVGNFSEGRSGSFVIFSADKQYILKTLSRREQRQLLHMLPRYYEFMRTQPRTLLCRFYGCYCITMHSQTIYFAVMESLFFGAHCIHERYDLKGSWLDRHRRSESNPTRLDGDMQRKLHLPPALRAQLLEQAEL